MRSELPPPAQASRDGRHAVEGAQNTIRVHAARVHEASLRCGWLIAPLHRGLDIFRTRDGKVAAKFSYVKR